MSKVFRFHAAVEHPASTGAVLLRKRRKRNPEPLHLVAADTKSLTDGGGTHPLESYRVVSGSRSVTLTRRESDIIALANPGVIAPAALEDLHPWLPAQWFLNDSVASFRAVSSVVARFGPHFVTAAAYCDERWNTVCNTLRRRSLLDARFYTAWHLPVQDVHILEERRPGRSVVAIDFNGMYPACMLQPFPKPAGLRLVRFDRELNATDDLATGLYRCILVGPTTDFIADHNPFRSFHSGRHLRTRLDEPVEVDLNEFEIAFFRQHFRRVHLVEAVIAEETIFHPLAKEVRRSSVRRANYRAQSNKALADREKFLATLMASCANRPSRLRSEFERRVDALEALRTTYGIDLPADEPEAAANAWLAGRKGITLTSSGANAVVQSPQLDDGSACHLLGQRIVARGRIVLLEMMERVLASAPDVRICYTNIDSIHFSLPTEHLAPVREWLESEASDTMGSFKIEAITEHGLWLEPGRYWLYSDTIAKFRNRSVGDAVAPFRDHSIHVASRQLGDLHVPIRATMRMERTMSMSRSLCPDPATGLVRQKLVEVGADTPCEEVFEVLEKNLRHAIPMKMEAFVALRDRLHLA